MNRNQLSVGGKPGLLATLGEEAGTVKNMFLGVLARMAAKRGVIGTAAAFAFAFLFGQSPANAAFTDFVAYDGTNVTFAPGVAVSPIAVGIIAAVGAALALFVIVVGVRWTLRMVKGVK